MVIAKNTPLDPSKAPLLPKLQGHFAEFLRLCFSIRLSMLYLTTGVGYKYGLGLFLQREKKFFLDPQRHSYLSHSKKNAELETSLLLSFEILNEYPSVFGLYLNLRDRLTPSGTTLEGNP